MKKNGTTFLIALTAILFCFQNGYSQYTYKYLGTWDSNGVPNYLEAQSDTVQQTLLDQIQSSLPESQKVTVHHPQYLTKGVQTDILLREKAEIYVTFVYEGAGYKNSLGFYTYDKNTPLNSADQIKNSMTVIFPNASMPGSGGNLKPGSKVKIGTFEAGTKIGWFNASDGFRGGKVTDGNWVVFSDEKLNPESDTTKRQHNVLLKDPVKGRIILGFEDIRRDNGGCDLDFNDVLFYITANPFRAIDTAYIPTVEEPGIIKTDLSITKTAGNQAPQNGSEVEYTITVTNNGNNGASNVKVSDLLPGGLVYLSSTVSAGSFNSASGLWTIANLNKNASATLTIKAKVDLYSNAYTLGPAKGYNVFALNDLNQPSSDAEGKVAVGHNAFLSNYSVGDKLTADSTADVLIVGNDLNFLTGAVFGGNVVYNNLTNLPVNQVSINNGVLKKASVIDFGAAGTYLNTLSSTLSSYTVNGTVKKDFSALNLKGSDPVLNVFDVKADEIADATDFNVKVPNGSVVLINIAGQTVTWDGGLHIEGTAINNVLYNFYEASVLTIKSIDIKGSILAPKADLDFPAGLISGQVIAKNINGQGQFNNVLFIGNIPVDRKINNQAQISSLDQTDTDLSNNSASSAINVAYVADPNSGQSSGTQSWTKASSLPEGHFIWTIKNDNSGKLLAGTFGGKILRLSTNGKEWTEINKDMNAGYIWSIATSQSGKILAATEQGVFKSADNGISWKPTALFGKDVRALAADGGSIYAGTWGTGMFKSNDDGESWNDISAGLINKVVNAIAINSKSEIFAATFGSGIEKSADRGATWTKLAVGYDHVWSVAATSDNKIYAGTYGDGLYFSGDNGSTWQKSLGLDADYIYSISPDKSGNVYLCSWSSGIFVSSDPASGWASVGMKGFGASAVYADPVSGSILAGANNGGIYSLKEQTSVESINNKPETYSLAQNYPNPFNPSTLISYSLPSAGFVTLKVYDMLGKEIASLVNETKSAGNHQTAFNAAGQSSGVYMYRLVTGSFRETRKMLFLK